MSRFTLPAVALVAAACGNANAIPQDASTLPARQVIVALDLSGSQSQAKREEAQRVVGAVIDGLRVGDRIVIMQVHERSAAEDQAIRWLDSIPRPRTAQLTSFDREALENVKRAARRVTSTIFSQEHAGSLMTTDLISTLHVAAEFMHGAPHRTTTLVLLSDMLQSANGISMERPNGIPSADWVRRQQEAGLVPSLEGACVSVVGADATTAAGVKVRQFWRGYFESAGARLPDRNYRLLASASPMGDCS
jgi:hypothetical protein